MSTLEQQNLEQEIKELPSRRNPLDPLSQQKPFLAFLLITYKHIESLPTILTHLLTFTTLSLLVSSIIAEKNSSDLVYKFISIQPLHFPLLILGLLINISILIFFLICCKAKKYILTRAEASSMTKYRIIFHIFAVILRFYYFIFFPFQILITLSDIYCEPNSSNNCGTATSKIFNWIFIFNLGVSIIYIYIMQSYLIGIHKNKDPMSTTVLPKLEVFHVTLILIQIVKNVVSWDANEQILRLRLTYALAFLMNFGYILYYKTADGKFCNYSGKIHNLSLGLISWLSLRQFIYSIVKNEYFTFDEKFSNLILIIEISICLKITWNFLEKMSNISKTKAERSLFDDMLLIKSMIESTEGLLLIKDLAGHEEINMELVNLKGIYKNHKIFCSDLNCSCKNDAKYMDDNLFRFRDFYLSEFQRLVERYPKNFNIRFYYVYYILNYERNLRKLTIQLNHLKSLISNSSLNHFRYLQIEIMAESMFNEIYKGKKRIDGLKINCIGQADLDNITASSAMRFLIKNKKSTDFLRMYDFITLDRVFNEMLDKMRDSIDVHQIFLDRLQKKHTNLRTIHNLVQLLNKLNKKVDKVYLKLREQAFKFTTIHLLPYGFFKNQTQNSIRECNIILREHKQKIQTSGKIFAKIFNKIQNINIEEEGVCFLLSMAKDTFMDIIYVTRSYEQVFGADISFNGANLMDILPPTTSEIHHEIVKDYLENMEKRYLSVEKTGLLSLKEHRYDQVKYIVNLFPSILLEPMVAIYVKRLKTNDNKYIIVINKGGVIEGCCKNLLEFYPDIIDLIGKRITTICKDLKEDIQNFRFYSLAVQKSQETGKSILYPGFRKSKIKYYKEEFEKMNINDSKGKIAIFNFSQKFQVEVKFKLRIDYFNSKDRDNHLIWLVFKVENELKNYNMVKDEEEEVEDLINKTPRNQQFQFAARRGLSRVTYINKLKMFQAEDEASKEIRMMFGGDNVDDKTKNEIMKKRATKARRTKTKIQGEGDDKRLIMEHKNNKRIQRPSFFTHGNGDESPIKKLREQHLNEESLKNKKNKKSPFDISNYQKNEEEDLNQVENEINEQEVFLKSARISFGDKLGISPRNNSLNLKYDGFNSQRSYRGKVNQARSQTKSNKHSKILNNENLLTFEKNRKIKGGMEMKNTEEMGIKENLGMMSSESGSLRSTKYSNIFSATNNPSIFRLSKYNFIILAVQILNIILAFIALIIVRFYYTDRNISYMTENRATEIYSKITNNLRLGHDAVMKLSLIQKGKLENNRFFTLVNSTNKGDEGQWYEGMGLENPEEFYREDLERRILKVELLAAQLHELVTVGMDYQSLNLIYRTEVDVYFYEHFGDNLESGRKITKMNNFNLINYMTLNLRKMWELNDFSTNTVMFQAIDLNIPTAVREFLEKFTSLFGTDEVDKFRADTQFAINIIIYCSIIISVLTLSTIPAFYKIRKTIIKIYRTLEDLYDFELRFKMEILDELEDALDVCQESMAVLEGLISIRTR